jgi:valyl-tRNA synthetase
MVDIPKRYEPHRVEEKWYRFWEDGGYFKAKADPSKRPFSVVIPPPNITGSLHMGHALNNTLQDIIVRFKRMQGFDTLWLPGTDHAGIATQNVVERELHKEGLTRWDLEREGFVERVWKWKEEYGERIIMQLKRLGASCDWSRQRFTMDPGLSLAVREVFVRLYNEGYIYRGDYIINWCPRCLTALSDIEVEHHTVNGHLYYIDYPIKGGGRVTVATTRPETMLGDTAVAANPDDGRYRSIIGKTAVLPILGREIVVIEDGFVDPEFGTGLVKVTPAHDPDDFEIAKRHHLPAINILNQDASMNENAGPYKGLDRYECRKRLIEDLEGLRYLKKIEEYTFSVGHCYRCRTVVEPYLSRQWFVAMRDLAAPAIEAVRDGRVRFIPKTWEKTYFEWMKNIKDWCISRQIWWGHRIPAWYCEECGATLVRREDPEVCECGSRAIHQDQDVLDTWFSSALWPFSTMGWPEKTRDLEVFYPTSLLSTGFDIIYFWVARMIIMGLKFMGKVPFRDVYIHALIKDVEGQKMSKSKGNIIDPLDVIEEYGADALRLTLAILAIQGRDILLSRERIEGYRHFCNKLWNAARFVLMNLEGYGPSVSIQFSSSQLCDRWIISRLDQVVSTVTASLEEYEFSHASRILYDFVWHEYCDWYIELTKIRLYGDDPSLRQQAQGYLVGTLDLILRLLHPFMPFITEEIWQMLPIEREKESIMVNRWPVPLGALDLEAMDQMSTIMKVVSGFRNIRSEMHIPPAKRPLGLIRTMNEAKVIKEHSDYIVSLGGLSGLEIGGDLEKPPHSAIFLIDGMELYLPLEGMIDLTKERARLEKELSKVERDLLVSEKKLSSENFLHKAKEEVVQKERERAEELRRRRKRLFENLEAL